MLLSCVERAELYFTDMGGPIQQKDFLYEKNPNISKLNVPSLKGKVLLVIFCCRGGGTPPATWRPITDFMASFQSGRKSFRIWSFQTSVASRFQGFCLKLFHLGEIFAQSWKIGGECGILTAVYKGAPVYTNITTRTLPFNGFIFSTQQ